MAEILALAVPRCQRRRGLGRQFAGALLDEMRQRGVSSPSFCLPTDSCFPVSHLPTLIRDQGHQASLSPVPTGCGDGVAAGPAQRAALLARTWIPGGLMGRESISELGLVGWVGGFLQVERIDLRL